MKDSCSLKFCVYVLCDPRKYGNFVYGEYSFNYEPFYVGKGKQREGSDYCRRPMNHISEAKRFGEKNNHKANRIRSILADDLEPISIIYKEFDDEIMAYEVEDEMIRTIGKRIDNIGPLTNIIDGGSGGCARGVLTNEQKETRRKNITEWWKNATIEERANHSKRISDAKKGKSVSDVKLMELMKYREEYWRSEIHREQRSKKYTGDSNPNAKYVYDVYENEMLIKRYGTLLELTIDLGFPKSRKSYIRECINKCNGRYKQYEIIRTLK